MKSRLFQDGAWNKTLTGENTVNSPIIRSYYVIYFVYLKSLYQGFYTLEYTWKSISFSPPPAILPSAILDNLVKNLTASYG